MSGISTDARRPDADDAPRILTGSEGLDAILGGGLDANRLYLYEGRPGTGKTTIALQFLLEGARRGERVLYITLSETAHELRLVARRHGWSLDNLDVIELAETTKIILDRVQQSSPTRVVLDSLSELRLLAQNPLRYRRQVLALKHFFSSRDCTVLVLDDRTSAPGDLQL